MPEWKPEIRRRLAGLDVDPRREAEIVEELAQHLDDRYSELRAAGLDDRQARAAALDELHAHELLRELRRIERPAMPPPVLGGGRGNMLADFWHDVRYGMRMLRKSPGFTLVAVLTLALGIGANATVFSWLNSVLITTLPGVEAPLELVGVFPLHSTIGISSVSYPDYRDFRDRNTTLAGLFGFEEQAVNLTDGERTERVWAQVVTGNFFDVLGVRAVRGRTFLPAESGAPGRDAVVVISQGLWQRRFAADPEIVNRTVKINDRAFTIIGVTPPEFQGGETGLAFDLWVPMMMVETIVGENRLESRGHAWFPMVGRLKPGVTVEQAEAEFNAIAAQIKEEHGHRNLAGVTVTPLWKSPRGAVAILGPVLLVLMGVVGVVLLITCANLANLLLARATGRRKEVAIRLALGAGRGRLVRQMLTESLLLAVLGGALGVVMAHWTAGLFRLLIPPTDLPVGLPLGVDSEVLLFSFALAAVTGVLFGLAPAWHAARGDLLTPLKEESAATTGGRRKGWLRGTLVVTQVALSLLLLVAAGLLLRSLAAAQTFDPGFNPRGVLLAGLDTFPNGYEIERRREFYRQLQERLQTLPGVESATIARRVPLGFGGQSSSTITIEGYTPANPDDRTWTYLNTAAPDYLRTLQIPLVRGREFTAADTAERPPVAVVNETFVRRYLGDGDPLGRRFHFGTDEWITIVGVAADSKYRNLNEPRAPYVYLPLSRYTSAEVNLHVRTLGDPAALAAAVRSAVTALDPALPVFNVRTLEEHIRAASFQQRMGGMLLAAFGGLALVLAAVGIYGVLAYMVSQRTHEIGIRVALGATRGDVVRLVLGHGLRLVGIGVALGLAGALAAGPLLGSLLFGIQPTDPLTFAGVIAVLVAVALVAGYVPARRATRVDPMVALRYE